MRAGSIASSLACALIVASLATTPVHATVGFDFEPPAYSTTNFLGSLVPQDGWVFPPAQTGVGTSPPSVVSGFFPQTQGQFAAVSNHGAPGMSRNAAEHLDLVHDLTKPLWTYQFDFAMEPADTTTASPPGVGPEFSLVPRDPTPGAAPTARTFALSWNREADARIATNISAYDATGQPFTTQLPDTGPGMGSGFMTGFTWYTFKIVVNTSTNECISLEWAPRGTTSNVTWFGFFLGGGTTSTLPAPNGIRLSSVTNDLAGFDNILIDTQTPEPTALAILALTSLICLSRRRTRPL
jgi:hypothetical protein